MRVLWSGRYKSVTPRDFKNMVDCYIPNMQGHAQQDAQEFLAFLMNELHEDLNRVHNRAYIPEPDSSRMEDRQLANLAWSNHLKRNNSVIVEFFQVIKGLIYYIHVYMCYFSFSSLYPASFSPSFLLSLLPPFPPSSFPSFLLSLLPPPLSSSSFLSLLPPPPFVQGMYRSTVVCNYCRKRSTTFEPFMYLSLPIPAGPRSYSLQVIIPTTHPLL